MATHFEEIFNDSYARILKLDKTGDNFFKSFYENFLTSSPEIQVKFKNTDMAKQRAMLKESFYYMLNFFVTKQSSNYMEEIALLHSKKGVNIPPHMYDLWLDSLVLTVADQDPDYTNTVGLAWKIIMATGIMYMKNMYDS